MGELHTLTGKPVDIRRRVTVSPVAGEITVPYIIQIHQDDVYIISLLFPASALIVTPRPLENDPLDLRIETYIECRLERFFILPACISDSDERKR